MESNQGEGYQIVLGDWAAFGKDASLIRHEVFVVEQHVSLEEEMDGRDEACVHAIAYRPDGVPVGTGRLLPDGHIGRLTVLRPQRGKGVGALLLIRLVDEARRQGHLQVELAAQLHAQPFYAAHGFVAEGPVFLDAGIDHINMRRILTA